MATPKISIITSTFNRRDTFLPNCIESVQKQSYKNIEHIIIDDCSTDETEQYVKNLMSKGYKLRYYKTEQNTGSDTRPKNIGIKKATGKYILHLDDDVSLRPKAIEHLVKEIEKGYDVVYGDMWLVQMNEPGIAHDFDLQFLSLRNYIDTSAALIKRSCLKYIGGWDTTLPKFVDWNLFVRLAKAGFKFKRLEELTFDYNIHENTKSQRVDTPMYTHPQLGRLFVPTFDPVSCPIRIPNFKEIKEPTVAIFTIHYDRPEYSKITYEEMKETAEYPFDWFCSDNGKEGLKEWIAGKAKCYTKYPNNIGLTLASNDLIDTIKKSNKYDIIIKIDNDVEFITYGWLKDLVELWKLNHLIYASPYVEGLVDNPGGAQRIGTALIGDTLVEVTRHIGGIFAMIDARAYDNFRWSDRMLHGYQDLEASNHFVKEGYMPCYIPKHIIRHRDTTLGQQQKYKDYFERRKIEKRTEYEHGEGIRRNPKQHEDDTIPYSAIHEEYKW